MKYNEKNLIIQLFKIIKSTRHKLLMKSHFFHDTLPDEIF